MQKTIDLIETLEGLNGAPYEYGQNFEEYFLRGKGRGKAKVKAFLNKAKDKLKNIGGKLDNAVFLPLLPFKPAMRKALEKRGQTAPKDLSELAGKFYVVVIQNKNFEGLSHLEEKAGSKALTAGVGAAATAAAPATMGASLIVPAILEFLKKLLKKDKKELTPEEKLLVDEANKSASAIDKSIDPLTAAEDASGEGFDFKKLLPIIIIAIILLIVLTR